MLYILRTFHKLRNKIVINIPLFGVFQKLLTHT